MIVSIHQPAYLPWLGYFSKLLRSDVFIFLDSVQFERNSFINRNRIKTANGPIWLTIPVLTKGHTDSTIKETRIDNRQPWTKKHLRSIEYSYRAAPRFAELFPRLEKLYSETAEMDLLADVCFKHLQFWLAELGIEKQVVRACDMDVATQKAELVLDFCLRFGATHYISGALGRDYLDASVFARAGIAVEFQDYNHPVYPQLHGKFLPFMGVVDFLMSTNDVNLITGVMP